MTMCRAGPDIVKKLQIGVRLYKLDRMDVEPTLLVGAEQSGTTLLRLMLDSHPEVSFAEEFEYAVAHIGPDGSFPSLEDYKRLVATNRPFSTSGFTIDEELSYEELINGFLQSRRAKKGALIVGATLHSDFSKALTLWPKAQFIHLVRDPRDVAPARMSEGLAGNVWHGLDSWITAEDQWAELEPFLDPDRVLTVRFADLIKDHDQVLTGICRFMGVEYTAQMLDYVADTDYQAPSRNVAGDWRTDLSTSDIRLIEARVGDRLTRLGFEPSGHGQWQPTDRHQKWLRWEDRTVRVSQRVQKYGLRLTVADLVARGVNHDAMQRSLRDRFNEADKVLRKKSWSDTAKYRTSR